MIKWALGKARRFTESARILTVIKSLFVHLAENKSIVIMNVITVTQGRNVDADQLWVICMQRVRAIWGKIIYKEEMQESGFLRTFISLNAQPI